MAGVPTVGLCSLRATSPLTGGRVNTQGVIVWRLTLVTVNGRASWPQTHGGIAGGLARAGACARSVSLTLKPALLWLSSGPHCSQSH